MFSFLFFRNITRVSNRGQNEAHQHKSHWFCLQLLTLPNRRWRRVSFGAWRPCDCYHWRFDVTAARSTPHAQSMGSSCCSAAISCVLAKTIWGPTMHTLYRFWDHVNYFPRFYRQEHHCQYWKTKLNESCVIKPRCQFGNDWLYQQVERGSKKSVKM